MFIHRFWYSAKGIVFVIYGINFPPRRRKLKFEKKEILYVNFVDTTSFVYVKLGSKYYIQIVVRV